MAKFVTVIRSKNEKKHYIELINGELDNVTICGVTGPFEQIGTNYKDHYENNICKKCFKSYISSLSKT